jgi:dihydrofolate reductase
MARLIYSAITSLDGYIADEDGGFSWAMPDEEVHGAVNDLMRPVGTHLYGRRLYEVMVAWETMETAGEPAVLEDFAAMWRNSDKVVYSTTLQQVASERTRIEGSFDPQDVSRLKATADRDLSVGGAELAGHALAAGLVDDVHLFVSPTIVGGGTRALPAGLKLPLTLQAQRRFGNGFVHLGYSVQN